MLDSGAHARPTQAVKPLPRKLNNRPLSRTLVCTEGKPVVLSPAGECQTRPSFLEILPLTGHLAPWTLVHSPLPLSFRLYLPFPRPLSCLSFLSLLWTNISSLHVLFSSKNFSLFSEYL